MTIKIRRDLTSGIALAIIAIVLWLMIPYHIVVTDQSNNAQMFPRLIVGFMFLVSVYIVGKTIITGKDVIMEVDLKKEGKIFLYALALIFYVFLMDKLGYLIATFAISGLTLAVYGAKRKSYLIQVGFVVIVFLLFRFGLGVPLP